jgi:transposase
MRQKSVPEKEPATQVVKNIRRATRRHFSAEDKIRIVLEGLRGEDSIAELCRREGIVQNLYYRWSKDFLEAGKKRLAGDTARAATSDEVKDLRRETSALKEVVAERRKSSAQKKRDGPRLREASGWSRSPPCRCGGRWKRSAFRAPPSTAGTICTRPLQHRRYHESIHNITLADVYCGRGQIILLQREMIKHHRDRSRIDE